MKIRLDAAVAERAGDHALAGAQPDHGRPRERRRRGRDESGAERSRRTRGSRSSVRAVSSAAAARNSSTRWTRSRIDVRGREALDVGASTGGFTDCLLQRGAARVTAVDVGYGQLDWRLRNDPRVRVMERVNFRLLADDAFPDGFDLIVDRRVVHLAAHDLGARGRLPARRGASSSRWSSRSSKPGANASARGGVVRDRAHPSRRPARRSRSAAAPLGLVPVALTASPLLGPAGNREFFMELRAARRRPSTTHDSRRSLTKKDDA